MQSAELPDFRTMTPSKAKEVLYGILYAKFETEPLNYRQESIFRMTEALRMFEDEQHEWVRKNILHECFERASRNWERKYPKCWDNDKQRAYRAGKAGYPR